MILQILNSELDKRLEEEDKEGLNQLVAFHHRHHHLDINCANCAYFFQVNQAEQIKQEREGREASKNGDKIRDEGDVKETEDRNKDGD